MPQSINVVAICGVHDLGISKELALTGSWEKWAQSYDWLCNKFYLKEGKL